MKNIRKEWPTVRQYVKNGATYYLVDVRKTGYVGQKYYGFSDRVKALKFASERAELRQTDPRAGTVLTEDPRITAWAEQCSIYGKTPEQAIELALIVFETCKAHGKKSADLIGAAETVFKREKQIDDSPFMSGLLSTWVLDKTESKLKPLRPRTEKSIRHMANMFKVDFGDVRMKELTKERIEKYLTGKNVGNQTRKNLRSYLGQFFNWAISKEHHNENPVEKIETHVQNGTPEYFTVEQCQEIMRQTTKDEHRKMMTYYSLCLFAGIRPEEAQRLNWKEHIKMDTKEIFIPNTISKTKKDRLFDMSENLFEWLTFCGVKEGSIIPVNFRKLNDAVKAGLSFDWIQDGMRHSFASYHYAKHKNLETLRHIMGNSSTIIEKFYKGVIPAAEIGKFWAIIPQSIKT